MMTSDDGYRTSWTIGEEGKLLRKSDSGPGTAFDESFAESLIWFDGSTKTLINGRRGESREFKSEVGVELINNKLVKYQYLCG